MNVVPLAEPEIDRLRAFLAEQAAPVDSYVEDHLLQARHFALRRDGARIGSAAVHGEEMLVHFTLVPHAAIDGRTLFAELVTTLDIADVMVATSDEWLLASALDRHSALRIQGTLFRDAGRASTPAARDAGLVLSSAQDDDLPAIRAMIGAFMSEPELRDLHAKDGLFVGRLGDEMVSLGVIEAPRLLPPYASIGIFVHESRRRQGLAVDTLAGLKRICYRTGWQPVAGCAYGNTGSWRSVERAGMVAGTRLLRITLTADESRSKG